MTEEELKNKCKERAKIFQQAMESCKSSNLMDCIEWFADRIAELEKENAELKAVERMALYSKMSDQLAKAKELLTRFVMASVYFNGKETDLVEEAEQFISEVEK